MIIRASAVLAALGACACTPGGPGPEETARYAPLCATALAKARAATPALEEVKVEPGNPEIMTPGPRPRLSCGLYQGAIVGTVSFDAICEDAASPGCTRNIGVVMGGTVVYFRADSGGRSPTSGAPNPP